MNTRKILGFGLGPIASALLGLISVPVMAWGFTAEDIGRINIVNIIVSFSVLLFSLGLDQAYVREYHETRDYALLLKTCFAPGITLLLIVAVLSLMMSSELSFWFFGVSNSVYYWLTLVCILLTFTSRFLSLILRMQERALAFSMSQLIPKVVYLLLIGLIVISGLPRQFLQLQLALLASTVAVLIIYAWNTREQWRPAWSKSIDKLELTAHLRYSIPLLFSGLAYWGLTATSALMLRTLSTFRELGIYSISMSVAGVAVIVQSIFTVVWAPVVYRWVADGADMSRVDRVARQALALVVGVFWIFGVFSWLIDYLLPAQYFAVKYLVLCSIAQPLLYTLSEVTCVGITITRRTMLSFWSTLVALLVNFGLNLLLVPGFGASGAVVANAIAFLVFFVARTESSVMVWRPLPRIKLYLFTGAAVTMSVVTVLLGPVTRLPISFIWLASIPVVAWAFRGEWRVLLGDFRRRVVELRA
jgi:O-antigen/teichoic acid export membrane protein